MDFFRHLSLGSYSHSLGIYSLILPSVAVFFSGIPLYIPSSIFVWFPIAIPAGIPLKIFSGITSEAQTLISPIISYGISPGIFRGFLSRLHLGFLLGFLPESPGFLLGFPSGVSAEIPLLILLVISSSMFPKVTLEIPPEMYSWFQLS